MATKKPSKRQITFDALLEDDVPLDPRVVLITDSRWQSCLDELKTAPYGGVDTEGYDDSPAAGGAAPEDDLDGEQAADFDPFSAIIRLIQVALPSGRCLVADLGGIGDDRAAKLRLYGDDGERETVTVDGVDVTVPIYRPKSFFDILRDFVESSTRPKLLHHAKFDALWLRIQFGWRMRCIRCTMLGSQLYWAGIRGIRHGLGFLTERAVAMAAPGVWVASKKLQRSEWRWRLSNAQVNYAALDALVMLPLFKWLGGLLKDAGMMDCALAEFDAIAAFVECEFNGLPVNPAMLDDHIEMWRRGRLEAIKPFLARYPGVEPSKTQVVAVALSLDDCYGGYVFYELDETKPRRQPVYILGQRFDFQLRTKDERYASEDDHSVCEAVLTRFSHLPWISALLDWRSMGVVVKWMEGVRRRVKRDGRVRGEFAQIAGGENRRGDDSDAGKGMGRSACKQPSLQQSANPQPKLSKLIHKAMRFQGDVTAMSPRMPFVPHDENAVGYLRWAVARLRGEAEDPFTALDARNAQEASGAALGRRDGCEAGDAASTRPSDPDEFVEDATPDSAAQPSIAARIAWYEELIANWSQQPEAMQVADFSQAHMRVAAQAAKDQQLCEDFNLDRDAHLKLAYDFGVATGQLDGVDIDDFFHWYDKGHSKQKFVKSLRQPAKTGNYTSLNLGSVDRLKGAGDTAKPPVLLPREQWEIIRDAWRKRYAGLFGFQRAHIKSCNKIDVVVDGVHYGAAWELLRGGRLWLKKEPDKYDRGDAVWCDACQRTHGKLTVKGTDAVALVWMRSEASAIKWAMGRILEEFDRHDTYFMARRIHPFNSVWGARLGSMAHDEVDTTSRRRYGRDVAACVRKWFAAGLRWTGVVDIPIEPREAKDSDLLVKSWAEK